MAAERWDEQVGSVADEAARLLESLRRSAESAAERIPDAVPSPPADAAPHDPFCTWCPLCRGAAVVRSLSPETLARLADLASVAASVLTDLASSRTAPAPPAAGDGTAADDDGGDGTASAPATAPARRSRPRRPAPAPARPIPVSDADDPQEAPRG